MIVREIVKDRSIIDNFDWFNDYDNTRNYLQYCLKQGEIDNAFLELFDQKFQEWLKNKK